MFRAHQRLGPTALVRGSGGLMAPTASAGLFSSVFEFILLMSRPPTLVQGGDPTLRLQEEVWTLCAGQGTSSESYLQRLKGGAWIHTGKGLGLERMRRRGSSKSGWNLPGAERSCTGERMDFGNKVTHLRVSGLHFSWGDLNKVFDILIYERGMITHRTPGAISVLSNMCDHRGNKWQERKRM